MKNRIYVAAPWIDREAAKDAAQKLKDLRYIVTQPWWKFESQEVRDEKRPAFLKMCAELDVRGVRTADAVLLFNSSKSEGKAVEQGIAIALNIPIVAIGERGAHSKNVFHYSPNYHWVATLEEGIAKLKEILEYE